MKRTGFVHLTKMSIKFLILKKINSSVMVFWKGGYCKTKREKR